jgi:hypothetical protein
MRIQLAGSVRRDGTHDGRDIASREKQYMTHLRQSPSGNDVELF